LGHWQEGTADFPGNFSAVETMYQGGSIRGFVRDEARGMNVSWTMRIPVDGEEYQDIIDAWNDGATVVVNVWSGGVQYGAEGKINLAGQNLKDGTLDVEFVGAKPEVYSG
jgi:hypothetical protein